MTTTTSETTIEGTTEDGTPETTTLRIEATEDGFEMTVEVDGQVVDGETFDTEADALDALMHRTRDTRHAYDLGRRAYRRTLRTNAVTALREALLGDAMDQDAAKAIRTLARLVEGGKAAAALGALAAVK